MANVPGLVTDPGRIKGGVIALPSGGGTIAAYVARPHAAGSYPGIVVIQEAFGLVDHICDLARRFANIGYNAVAPALYWRRGAPKDPDVMEQVFPVMFGLPDSEALQDLEAAADYLNAMPGATGKVGAIGFCVLLLATCLLGAWAMRSVSGALWPAVGWIVASFVLSMPVSSGSVIITNSTAGKWYLYGGAVSALAGIALSFGALSFGAQSFGGRVRGGGARPR